MTLQERIRVAPSPIHGQGVFAVHRIDAETLIGLYEGQPSGDDGTYVLWVEVEPDGAVTGIEGTNELRFLNHSAQPNAEFDGPELYALRDIEAGEEITFDYGEEWATD